MFFVLSLPVMADDGMRDSSFWQGIDTVCINEISIVTNRLAHYNGTEKKDDIDTTQLQMYSSSDVSYLLGKTSLVNIVSYGSTGRQSTINIRGGSSNHTAVLWNGIPVNSLTTGGADLSMLNVGAFDQISVVYGASGAIYGSGTFGGALLLNNEHSFIDNNKLAIDIERASFSNNRISLGGKISNDKISYSAQVFYVDGKNDFTFKDTQEVGSPIDTMTNAENIDFGMIHSLGLKLNGHNLSFGLWYQVKDLNIGGKMGYGPPVSHQSQKDSTLKAYANWKYLLNKVRFEYQTAWASDFLRYTDRDPLSSSWKIFSEIGSKRWLNNFNVRYYWLRCLNIDVNLKYNSLKGITSNYKDNPREDEVNFAIAGQYKTERLTINGSASKEWNTVTSPPVVYHAGMLGEILRDFLYINAKYSTYYRRPTFNERYWVPGGNPSIKAERGYGYEGGVKAIFNSSLRNHVIFDLNAYRSINEEMIIWVPDEESGFSKPENTNDVLANGIEASLHCKWVINNSVIDVIGRYAYNNTIYNDSEADNYKHNLAYKPNNIFRANVGYSRSKWNVGVNASYQSDMFSVEGEKMNNVFLTDCFARYNLTMRNRTRIAFRFKVNNVLNSDYQLVYGFPMPRRNYSIGINISI